MNTLNRSLGFLTFFASLGCAASNAVAADALQNWPQWRGPLASGAAPQADPPLAWSETQNVKWKVKLPGFGTSTPVVWGDRVFVLTAVATGQKAAAAPPAEAAPARPGGPGRGGGGFGIETPRESYEFVVLCYERPTGKQLWRKAVREVVPHQGHHRDHGFASASPVTDGEHLLAYFGSRGLHCLDLAGNLKWSKDFGQMQTRNSFGEGASPALHGNTVVVYWDDEADNDFIAALDKRTGEPLWRKARKEETGWSTPLIVEHAKKFQAVVTATGKVRSYDLATGEELWSCAGQTANCIPTPVADADTVYVTSGFRGSALLAIALGRTGDLTGTDAIRWSYGGKNTPYVPSPLLVDGLIYTVTGNNALLSCFEAKTGKPQFEAQRLEGTSGIYASPVSAKDRVYVLGREGKCLVLKKGPKLEVLATNALADKTDASIALAGKDLFIRGHQSLYCIAEK
jgi:outer membrane protein assembly factor BamB